MIKKFVSVTAALVIVLGATVFSCTKDKGKADVPVAISPDVCDSATYNFKVKDIVDTKCKSCHNPSGQQPTPLLTDYGTVKTQADAGRIKIRAIDANQSPMPPSGSPELTSQEKAILQCWLDKGSPE